MKIKCIKQFNQEIHGNKHTNEGKYAWKANMHSKLLLKEINGSMKYW